ncbi:hypothetical protein PYCCODRAFT_1440742 [Trametes coccinea BRFM310]|uniref:Uncharacterized protein n=1 Tax=Trametes coccinea (strain BRFM310) TaxID=1353009 RepID=A0A1Y2I6R2_TRAC3|nr:hypothetical protein PYCCODRAFT_1440742 [Trametes coccinea BRFM310]
MTASTSTCTCGKCFEGWLSPRMRERLEYSTDLRYGLAKSLLDTQDGLPADVSRSLPIDYAEIDIAYYYLPQELREKITSSSSTDAALGDAIYRGYIAVFKVIKDMVAESYEDSNDTPSSFPTVWDVDKRLAELRSEAAAKDAATSADAHPPATLSAKTREHLAAYLDNGGTAEYALDCIVDRAREELSPLGKLYDADQRYIDAVLDGEDGEERPECPNDLDFALVRVRLGLPLETRGVEVPEDEVDVREPVSDEEQGAD